jgi:predicted PolB exonuclease-like 3'-5' exonuclease
MNIGSVDPIQEVEHWILEMRNLLLDQETFVLAEFYYKQTDKPKFIQTFTYKNFDALDKSSTQFDLGTNFFLDGQHAKITAQYSARPFTLLI